MRSRARMNSSWRLTSARCSWATSSRCTCTARVSRACVLSSAARCLACAVTSFCVCVDVGRRGSVLARDRAQVVDTLDQVGEAVRLRGSPSRCPAAATRRRRRPGRRGSGDRARAGPAVPPGACARRSAASGCCRAGCCSTWRLDSSAERRVCRSSMFPWKPAIWCSSASMPERTWPSLLCAAPILSSSAPGVEPLATEPSATVAPAASASTTTIDPRVRARRRRLRRLSGCGGRCEELRGMSR